ncbi:MAG: hypothetical protein HY721_32655 [Planctomycetes bacterium]|nr:hypothetical protein [Planctomycetota bacterium]
MTKISSVAVALVLASPVLAAATVRRANFDPDAGPNQYEVVFPAWFKSGSIRVTGKSSAGAVW